VSDRPRDSKGRFKATSRPARSVSGPGHVLTSGVRGTYTATGYHSVRVLARDGIAAGSAASGDAHLLYDRATLVNQSRKFLRDNAIYKGIVERFTAYTVGNGFTLDAKTGDAEVDLTLERLWKDWMRRADIREVLTASRLQRMLAKELAVAGDLGIIMVDNGQLQLVESEQISGPSNRCNDGIARDKINKPTQYFVTGYGRHGRRRLADAKPYTPDSFIFLTDPERPSAVRTAPPTQSAFPMLHRINDVCDSEAIAWQLLARLALSVQRDFGPEDAYNTSTADDTAGDDQWDQRVTEMGYALIFHCRPGEKIEGVNRNLPGKDFGQSITMFLRLLGLPLGLPLEIVLLDWTKSNYSQSRAVLQQAYQTFLGWQELLEDKFYDRVYRWKVGQWIRDGLVLDRPESYAHQWIKPSFPWIDQVKEAQAWGLSVDRGFTTHGAVCKSQGTERQAVVDAREKEIRDAIARARAIAGETGVEVPWQILAGMMPPGSQPLDTGVDANNRNGGPDDA